MNLLEKICLAFVMLIVGIITLGALSFAFYALWICAHPAVAILVFLFTAAVTYLMRDSKTMPK